MTLHYIWLTLFGGCLAIATGIGVPKLHSGGNETHPAAATFALTPNAAMLPQTRVTASVYTPAPLGLAPPASADVAKVHGAVARRPAQVNPASLKAPLAETPPLPVDGVHSTAPMAKLGPPMAVEMMRAAAKDVPGPPLSQLDVILDTLRTPSQPISPKWVKAPPSPRAGFAPHRAPIMASANVARPKTRPDPEPVAAATSASKPEPEQDAHEAKPYSAEHFNKLGQMGHQPFSSIACVAELQLITARAQIYFASGSAAVGPAGTSAARLIAAKAQSCPEAEVHIVGFTDPGGPTELNLKLSWLRANKVYQTIEEAGFSTTRIAVASHMEGHPEDCVHYDSVDRRVIFNVREASAN